MDKWNIQGETSLCHYWTRICCSVAKSYQTLWPHRHAHGLQHARLFCFPLSPGVCSNSCPLSRRWYLTLSSSATLFSFCLQSFPASGSFPMNQLFISGSQSIGASASVLPMNIQDWFPLGLTGLISLLSKGLSRVFSNTKVQNNQFFIAQPLWSDSHPYMTSGKTIALTRQTFVNKVMSLLFNALSRYVITFLPRNKHLLISWLLSPSTASSDLGIWIYCYVISSH